MQDRVGSEIFTWGTWGAKPRPKEAEQPKPLAPEIGPGLLPIATPQIRPRGARNPQAADPFRGAGSGVAEILEIR